VSARIFHSGKFAPVSGTPHRAARLPWSFALFFSLLALIELPAAEITPAKAEPFDILYLSDSRPVVVRLNLVQNGKSMLQEWNRFVDIFFAKLDTDKNGVLDAKELSRLRPMIIFLTSDFNRMPAASTAVASKSMNRVEFGEFLKKNDLGPLRMPANVIPQRQNRNIRRGGVPTTEELDKAILELLDTNKDGKISVAEFKAGVEILSKLDMDENELITTEEIMKRPQSPYYVQVMEDGKGPPSPGVELYPITRKGADANLAKRLLMRYGPKPANSGPPMPYTKAPGRPVPYAVQTEPTVKRLTKKDLKVSDAMFAALDQDGDDELDIEELSRFGQNVQPEIEIAINIGKLEKGAKAASVIKAGNAPLKVYAGPADTEISIEVPGVRLDLRAPQVVSSNKTANAFRNGYLNRFRNADQDGNGYIDMNESNFDPVFRELFSFFDRDGDGKIFEKELIAALDEAEEIVLAASTGIASIELNENGRGLFGAIDINSDGKLSIPELRAMPQLVERFAANKEVGLAPVEVPRRFEASFSHGISMIRQTFAPVQRFDGMTGQPRAQTGPLWFQKMDRNRDGYVSRREFLGTDEQFRKLDLDGDGFISLEEAEAAEKKK
jgi:Ca2+-binding EF-hand superfamily protein